MKGITRLKNIDLETRIENLRREMQQADTDTVIIFSDENRRYLSGFTGSDGNYDESAGVLIITSTDLLLATDSRYDTQASQEATLYNVSCYKENISKELPLLLKSVNSRKVGLETSRLTVEIYDKIKTKLKEESPEIITSSADKFLKTLRIKKDNNEIEAIKKSLAISEQAFLKLRTIIHEDMTEKEAAWLLEKMIRENGADCLSFPTIVASGKNCALPHAIPGERKFNSNEPLLFDFGAKLKGYCSDTTRTIVIGEPDSTFKEAYDTLFHAQKFAVEAIKPGIKCSEIDRVARDYIDNSKFTGRFGHSLGHGVGIAIHESPRLSKFDDTLLEAGMVVTVEPGIYIPEWGGIRLENMICVTDEGSEVLNKISYDDYII
ncbi:PepQ [Desulfamplus magnetovallimortis]|uniref:PepQ n=1 Tax=Desulfamplus magnetovallimortis TaxID=1246637 RepID=A0A1W1HCK8_9BACT|nr:PepQ [Desulfamplus magnetovallimortis]